MLFGILMQSDEFPFNQNGDLKHRINSRMGDPASVKLAYDVHTLLSVVEGDDYSLRN